MNKNTFVVIMAGGVGSRFWPISRTEKPKQFIDILGVGKTMLQLTYERFKDLCPDENFFIVTNYDYKDYISEQLPHIPEKNILLEPLRRNTAPCIAYAIQKIKAINPIASMVITPADHIIVETEKFKKIISDAVEYSQTKNVLLTLGIKPTRPETGYGYIQIDELVNKDFGIHKVKTFTEKPEYEMAKVFVESGEFLWNAGIFVWNINTIIKAFRTYLPHLYLQFESANLADNPDIEEVRNVYSKIESISIDFGILEKAQNVEVIPCDFTWSDLGTWSSLYNYCQKDSNNNVVINKNAMLFNTSNCIINVEPNVKIICNDLQNLIIAQSQNYILISSFNAENKLRHIIDKFYLEFDENK